MLNYKLTPTTQNGNLFYIKDEAGFIQGVISTQPEIKWDTENNPIVTGEMEYVVVMNFTCVARDTKLSEVLKTLGY